MKTATNLLRLTLLTALTIARTNAQTVEEVIIFKGTQFVQTSGAGAVVDPKAPGPNYGGPYSFQVSVQGTTLSGIAAPVITLAAGSTWPTDNPTHHNGGLLVFDSGNQEWKYGFNANNYGGPTEAGRDAAFAVGTYHIDISAFSASFDLSFPAPGTYPVNTPSVTLTGGSWVAGKYVIDVSQPLTVTSNSFTNFDQNANAAMELQVEGSTDLFAFYSDDPAASHFQTFTIPGGTLTADRDYQGRVSFYGIMDQPVVAALGASLNASVYAMETQFIISTISAPTPGAQATLYRVGDLGGNRNGGFPISEVRDVTKTGGVIYAVGGSAAYDGSSSADTAFLWTSTAGMTALPNIVNTTTVNPSFVTASAITPDATYIAGRTRASTNGSQRHAVRTTTSGLTNLDLGYLAGYPLQSAAIAISNDGSVMYGFSRYQGSSKLQAVRFTASGPTVTAIPFLGGSDDQSSPAARGTSSDGSVMVGTSSFLALTGGDVNLPGNQAFRYVHGTGTSAIPFLGGGSWNNALAVSPDGNLSLVAGNSYAFPNGEVYLHNASGASTISLGAPSGYFGSSSVAGMTSDGSVVAITFSSPTSQNFIRNASGWHNLTTVLTSAGVSMSGWSNSGNVGIFGLSADGTLLWGSGNHNGHTEGWILEFTPGYLAGYGALHDFNSDGKADILWENTVTGQRYLWLMNGTAYGSGLDLGVIPTVWRIAASADFTSDGKPDILWENTSTGQRYLWLMNGTAYVSGLDFGVIPTDWRIAAAADFNADGKTDILWENTSTGQRYLWLMNGTAYGSGVDFGVIPTAWRIAAAADFNLDGKTDIVWENTSTGQHYLWLMNGTAYGSGVPLATIATAWRIGTVGDFNGDGNVDILWENSSTGNRTLWLMTGTAHTSTINWGIIPTDWHITN